MEAIATKLQAKEVENGTLWDQMRRAATEYQQEFLDKEATIRDLINRHESEKEHIREDMMRAKKDVEVSFTAAFIVTTQTIREVQFISHSNGRHSQLVYVFCVKLYPGHMNWLHPSKSLLYSEL